MLTLRHLRVHPSRHQAVSLGAQLKLSGRHGKQGEAPVLGALGLAQLIHDGALDAAIVGCHLNPEQAHPGAVHDPARERGSTLHAQGELATLPRCQVLDLHGGVRQRLGL